MKRFVLKKLVRDLSIENLKKDGVDVNYKVIDNNENLLKHLLHKKLIEEAIELKNSRNPQARLEEFVDVIDILGILLEKYNISWSQVIEASEIKKSKRGGFTKNYYIDYIEVPDDHFLVPLYEKK